MPVRLSIGPGMYHGIQSKPMEVDDLQKLQEKPAWRTPVEWLVGQAIEHPRAVSRGHGFTDIAAVA